jgi:excisionase family DNA binding protein
MTDPHDVPSPVDAQAYEFAKQLGEKLGGISAEEILRSGSPAFVLESLSRKQAAREAKVSVRTLSTWLKKGLPHVKSGRTVLIIRADLHRWLRNPSAAASRPPGSRSPRQFPV